VAIACTLPFAIGHQGQEEALSHYQNVCAPASEKRRILFSRGVSVASRHTGEHSAVSMLRHAIGGRVSEPARDDTAARFESNRPRLVALAHRLLGDPYEAEDVVQETWIRYWAANAEELDNVDAWLTTVASRLCLDRLRWRHVRAARSSDADASELAVPAERTENPEEELLLAEAVGAALLRVLDELAPVERLAFVLHDVFDVPFDEIARIVDRSPTATRQIASRARRRVRDAPAAPTFDLARHRQVVEGFLAAARAGDMNQLLAVLDPDVALRTDAVASSLGALKPVVGAEAVASTFLVGASGVELGLVDGVTALVWAPGGRARGIIDVTVDGERVVALTAIAEPSHLARLEIVFAAR